MLSRLSVLPKFNREIANIDIGIHKRPERRVGVERFTPAKLFFGLLQIAIADVDPETVAENELRRLLRVHVFCRLTDDNCQLDLEIGLVRRVGYLDPAVVREKRAWRFEPDQRGAQWRSRHLANVIGVIETDRD